MENFVVLNAYPTRVEAEIDKGLLENSGIKLIISSNDCGGSNPFPGSNSLGTHIKVSLKDLDKAKKILKLP